MIVTQTASTTAYSSDATSSTNGDTQTGPNVVPNIIVTRTANTTAYSTSEGAVQQDNGPKTAGEVAPVFKMNSATYTIGLKRVYCLFRFSTTSSACRV